MRGKRRTLLAVVLAALIPLGAARATAPEPTGDPEHPFARELMAAYATIYDIARRGDVAAAKQLTATDVTQRSIELPDWLASWMLKFGAWLMLDQRSAQFVAVDVADTGDAARLILEERGQKKHTHLAAIFLRENGAWQLVRTSSKAMASLDPGAQMDELRADTDQSLCVRQPAAGDEQTGPFQRIGSDDTGYRVSCARPSGLDVTATNVRFPSNERSRP